MTDPLYSFCLMTLGGDCGALNGAWSAAEATGLHDHARIGGRQRSRGRWRDRGRRRGRRRRSSHDAIGNDQEAKSASPARSAAPPGAASALLADRANRCPVTRLSVDGVDVEGAGDCTDGADAALRVHAARDSPAGRPVPAMSLLCRTSCIVRALARAVHG